VLQNASHTATGLYNYSYAVMSYTKILNCDENAGFFSQHNTKLIHTIK